jgi:hypothetical protein
VLPKFKLNKNDFFHFISNVYQYPNTNGANKFFIKLCLSFYKNFYLDTKKKHHVALRKPGKLSLLVVEKLFCAKEISHNVARLLFDIYALTLPGHLTTNFLNSF